MDLFAGRKYHFIGAGGIGMSGLARVLLKQGAVVTGSDQEDSAVLHQLGRLGADIKIGHRADNLRVPVEAVVISAAISATNPELARACETGSTIYKYAEMLGRIMDHYTGIAVAGTHGKSTTSGWLAFLLEKAGLSPSFIIGAKIEQLGASSGVGEGRLFVAEACEYDRSFLNLCPQIGIILNIEQDHLDYYADEDEIIEAFGDFAQKIHRGGVAIVNGQDSNIARALESRRSDLRVITFGLAPDLDFNARNLRLRDGLYSFDLYRNDSFLGSTGISLPGLHNVMNALAVCAAAEAGGLDIPAVLEILPQFTGMERRIMLKAQIDGITILDDYAHHPTEIRASLQAIRHRYNPKRLWCIFQPHQYSRTRFLLDDFAQSFKLADITVVPEIYFVRDTAETRSRINSAMLVEHIRQSGSEAIFINDFAGILEYLKANVSKGDLLVTMGAGTIWKVADEYIRWLGKDS